MEWINDLISVYLMCRGVREKNSGVFNLLQINLYSTLNYESPKNQLLGSGCGSVGRVVASITKGPWFESSHRQKNYPCSSIYELTI